MDELGSALGLGTVTVFQGFIAVFTVVLIQGIRKILAKYVKGGWTQKIPGWVWMALSIFIPIGLVYILNLNWVQQFVVTVAPDDVVGQIDTSGSGGVLWSGIATAMGAGGSYQLAKRKGWLTDYKPGGPNDVTEQIKQEQAAAVEAEEERHQAVVAAAYVPGPTSSSPSASSPVVSEESVPATPPAETPSGFYIKARLSPYNEYAMLTSDGRLYLIKDGKATPAPKGWNQ